MEYSENNERLEFIGDAYLDAIIGNKLYEVMPNQPEGVLSKTRANVVCERSLATIARNIGLGDFLFWEREEMYGGREKDSILADAVEAIIGAIIRESGYDCADRVVLKLFEENILLALQGKLYHDYKTALQEKLQERYKNVRIQYESVSESGPDHRKVFYGAGKSRRCRSGHRFRTQQESGGTGSSQKSADERGLIIAI